MDQAYEIVPMLGGTYLLRIFSMSKVSVSGRQLPEGRDMTSMQSFPDLAHILAYIKANPPTHRAS